MKCETVQQKLSVWSNERHSERETRRVESHVRDCPACSAFRADVGQIERLAGFESRPTPVRSTWRVPTALAAMAAMAAVTFVALHAEPAYASMRPIEQALQQVPAFHIVWRVGYSSGSPELLQESWFDRGRWRKTSALKMGGDRIFLPKDGQLKFYRYDPTTKTVPEMNELADQTQSVTVDTIAPDLLPKGEPTTFHDRGRGEWNGKATRLIEIAARSNRALFWVNPQTSLPVHVEKQGLDSRGWTTSETFDIDFAPSWPDSIFDPRELGPTK